MQRIALIGMPRSGTTWLGKIFDSHPATLYRHEPDSGPLLAQLPFAPALDNHPTYQSFITDFSTNLWQVRTARVAGKRPVFPKQFDHAFSHLARQLSVLLADAASRRIQDFPVYEAISKERCQSATVVWKSIQSTARLGVLARCLPDTKFIHILRHPCGYVASILRGEKKGCFSQNYHASEDNGLLEELLRTEQAQEYGLTTDSIAHLSPEERLAWGWVLINQKAMDDTAGQAHVMHLKYENVCHQPTAETRRAFAFAGLDWRPQTAAFLQASVTQNRHAYYSVFKDPLKSATAWHHELAPQSIERVLKVVQNSRLAHMI
jgi:hypothetical protein